MTLRRVEKSASSVQSEPKTMDWVLSPRANELPAVLVFLFDFPICLAGCKFEHLPMILSVAHPDIDPTYVIRTGQFPEWLEDIKSLVDADSNFEVGYMRISGDDKNFKAVTQALQLHLPGCRILRVFRPHKAPPLVEISVSVPAGA